MALTTKDGPRIRYARLAQIVKKPVAHTEERRVPHAVHGLYDALFIRKIYFISRHRVTLVCIS